MQASSHPPVLVRASDRTGSTGCLSGVLRDGKIVCQRGYGYTNLDYDSRHGPGMAYYVGSVSKQYTGAAISLLPQAFRASLVTIADVRWA